MLRQEVYELDVDALERGEQRAGKALLHRLSQLPYPAAAAAGDNRHAVFLVTESEAITYHYELDLRAQSPPDPRIAHTLNLKTDEYGNVLAVSCRGLSAAGPPPGQRASPADRAAIDSVQTETHLAYTENRYTNDVIEDDHYRLRCLARS